MKFFRQNKKNNSSLIVFFNGWGQDEKIVSNLLCDNFDVLIFYDYCDFNLPPIDISNYEKKYLIAWSMGVFVCNYFYENFKDFNKYIAINGTQKPIDDEFGIPKFIYDMTIENFNEHSCSKFMKKISPDFDLTLYCQKNTEELKSELISIRDLKVENYFDFDKVFISERDKIIPFKNQMNFWSSKNAEIIKQDTPHYIFNKYKAWSDFL